MGRRRLQRPSGKFPVANPEHLKTIRRWSEIGLCFHLETCQEPWCMEGNGRAFVKGGAGCFVAFLVVALLVVIFGGSAHLDLGGVVILFLIGGIIGLIANWIYQKGKRDAGDDDDRPF
jgi:hypothetical protein